MKKKLLLIFICMLLCVFAAACMNVNSEDVDNTLPSESTTPTDTSEIVTIPDESVPLHSHEFKTEIVNPTCNNGGYTLYYCECGYQEIKDDVVALGHDFITDTIKATYTTKGYDLHTCKVCGHVVKDNETDIIPHDHKYEKKVTEPTCTKKGYTTHTCSLCGHSYKDSETDMIAHNYESKTVAPTCTAKGYDLHTCKVCKKEYKDNEVAKIAHNYGKKTTAPTCTEKGYDTFTCKACKDSYKDNYTDMIPHNYQVKTVKPTCVKKGYDLHTCTVCKNEYKDNETDLIAHDYNQKVTAPTCVDKGYTTFTCKVCEKSYKDNYTDATGHNYVKSVVAPTYTEKGYDLYKCSVCGDSYKDNYVDVVPHDCDYAEKTVQPTCTEKGSTSYTCKICNKSKDTKVIDALGHDYVTETVKPTPFEQGYDVHTCSRCKDSYKDNYKDPVVTYKEVNETVYATTDVNIRKEPNADSKKLGSLAKNKSITRVGIGDNGWSKVMYNNAVAYIHSDYLTTVKPVISENGYPKTYSDSTCKITVYKEWWENAYVYAAHVQFSDYSRLWMECANGKYNSGGETTSHAAKRVGAILAINGDYAVPGNGAGGYAIARKGKVCNDKKAYPEGVYNSATGKLTFGHSGRMLSELVAEGLVTDTFQFGPVFLKDGKIIGDKNSNSRAQRTFIGTNGSAGDIWMCVSDGRYNDGKSAGLNAYQCGSYLVSKGCTLGIPLDGGGSSTIYFNGKVLNAASGGQRSVVDFLVFK